MNTLATGAMMAFVFVGIWIGVVGHRLFLRFKRPSA